MSPVPLAIELDGAGVLRLTLQRPERRNALSTDLGGRLRSALEEAKNDPKVQVIVLRGAGECFCGGADVAELRDASESRRGDVVRSHMATRECWGKHPKPTIAAVHGPAVGLGCVLALQADFVVATEAAVFSLPEARLGHSVVAPEAYIARFGLQRANQLLVACQPLGAVDASAWGFVNYVAKDAIEFDRRIEWLAKEILMAHPLHRKIRRTPG
jgi:enoyl-CoA hydratase/carnithine racemase